MTVLLAAVLAAVAAMGLLVMFRGAARTPPPLESVLKPAGARATTPGTVWWIDELEARVSGTVVVQRQADLAVLDRSYDAWRWRRIAWVAASVATLIVVYLGLKVITGGTPSVVVVVAVVVAALALGWFVAGWELASDAAEARVVIRHAVSLYLELAAVALAGGAGPAEAMRLASHYGHGRGFALINAAIAGAEARRVSPYAALEELGNRIGVAELVEVGKAMALADEKGAPIRSTLNTKANSVSFRLMNAEESAAESRSVAMSLPSVLMLSGFLLFLMFPFVAALLETTK